MTMTLNVPTLTGAPPVLIRPWCPADNYGVSVMVHGMVGERYPGREGGPDERAHLCWLESVVLLERWVAVTADGTVVGHVALSPLSAVDEECAGRSGFDVSRWMVDPQARRRRAGARLLSVAAARVHALGRVPMLFAPVRAAGVAELCAR